MMMFLNDNSSDNWFFFNAGRDYGAGTTNHFVTANNVFYMDTLNGSNFVNDYDYDFISKFKIIFNFYIDLLSFERGELCDFYDISLG
jgi:hypothetical protein